MKKTTPVGTLGKVAEEMRKNTKSQAKKLNKKLPIGTRAVYSNVEKLHPELFEHKKRNRWVLTFPKRFNFPDWLVSTTTLPSYPFDENNSIWVDLLDPIGPSTTKAFLKLLNGRNNNFKIKIDMLDPTGISIEKWRLYGCKIISADWDDLDYECDELCKIHLYITFQNIKIK